MRTTFSIEANHCFVFLMRTKSWSLTNLKHLHK